MIKEIYWYPPKVSWVKCNIDGIALGRPDTADGKCNIAGTYIFKHTFLNCSSIHVCCLICKRNTCLNTSFWA
jgi:hypothetical protein